VIPLTLEEEAVPSEKTLIPTFEAFSSTGLEGLKT
jgi:hypothetical protein